MKALHLKLLLMDTLLTTIPVSGTFFRNLLNPVKSYPGRVSKKTPTKDKKGEEEGEEGSQREGEGGRGKSKA